MNLQALYDLKERLEYAAIAGTGLLQEDFRLRRAVEGLAPLAKVNPVFAKIGAAVGSLLAAAPEERGIRLLDVLSLVDAVVYTQGVSNLAGDLRPLAPGAGCYTEVSYARLQPLLTALGGTGSGRTALIRNTYSEHPEFFRDFRVLPHVVRALGDSYAELADLAAVILLRQGSTVIPMLKEGFDPEGKAEMVRRVRLMARLAGESENDWFAGILPHCKKDVREAVIQALSLSRDNDALLLELCQSERGRLKEAALRSLAVMESQACTEQLRREVHKKPDLIAVLKGVGSTAAGDLAAEDARRRLEAILEQGGPYDHKTLDSLRRLTDVIAGKYTPLVAQLWHWIARHMDAFSAIAADKNLTNCDLSVAEHLQKAFLQSVLWNARPEMLALARALTRENREWFLCGGFLADMAELSAARLYEQYAPLITREGLLKRENAAQRSDRIQIMRGLAAVRWSAGLHGHVVSFTRFDALTGDPVASVRRLDGVDPGWIGLLTDSAVKEDGAVYDLTASGSCRKVEPAMDWIISWLTDGDDPEICDLAGAWLYRWTWTTGQFGYHFSDLIRCGWKNWQGLLAHCVAKQGSVSYYGIMEWIPRLPVRNAERAEELRRIDLMVQRGEVSVLHGHWPRTLVSAQIAALEADPNGGM